VGRDQRKKIKQNLEITICDLKLDDTKKYLYVMADGQLNEGLVISKIYVFRGQRVMLDADLAELYEVETRQLNQQVGRNVERFPEDFMFQLSAGEFDELKAGGGSWGGRRYAPYAFTEHGVLMLSSVLTSKRAVEVNIQIMRVFTRMREVLMSSSELLLKVERIERELSAQGEDIETIYAYVKKLIEEPPAERRQIGFKRGDES